MSSKEQRVIQDIAAYVEPKFKGEHTETAKQIAKERHQFMEGFLEQFFKEWQGNTSFGRNT